MTGTGWIVPESHLAGKRLLSGIDETALGGGCCRSRAAVGGLGGDGWNSRGALVMVMASAGALRRLPLQRASEFCRIDAIVSKDTFNRALLGRTWVGLAVGGSACALNGRLNLVLDRLDLGVIHSQ